MSESREGSIRPEIVPIIESPYIKLPDQERFRASGVIAQIQRLGQELLGDSFEVRRTVEDERICIMGQDFFLDRPLFRGAELLVEFDREKPDKKGYEMGMGQYAIYRDRVINRPGIIIYERHPSTNGGTEIKERGHGRRQNYEMGAEELGEVLDKMQKSEPREADPGYTVEEAREAGLTHH